MKFNFYELPEDVIINIICKFFTLKDIIKLDTSTNNKKNRKNLLSLLKHHNSIIHNEYIENRKTKGNVFKYIIKRQIKVKSLKINDENVIESNFNLFLNACFISKDHLELIEIKNCKKVNDEMICTVSKSCTRLIDIHISGSPLLTDKSMVSFSIHNLILKKIYIGKSDYIKISIAYMLRDCKQLNTICLDNLPNLPNDIIRYIGKFGKRITSLSLLNLPKINNKYWEFIMKMIGSNLKEIFLSSLNLSNECVASIFNYSFQLEKLYLRNMIKLDINFMNMIINDSKQLKSSYIMNCNNMNMEIIKKSKYSKKELCVMNKSIN